MMGRVSSVLDQSLNIIRFHPILEFSVQEIVNHLNVALLVAPSRWEWLNVAEQVFIPRPVLYIHCLLGLVWCGDERGDAGCVRLNFMTNSRHNPRIYFLWPKPKTRSCLTGATSVKWTAASIRRAIAKLRRTFRDLTRKSYQKRFRTQCILKQKRKIPQGEFCSHPKSHMRHIGNTVGERLFSHQKRMIRSRVGTIETSSRGVILLCFRYYSVSVQYLCWWQLTAVLVLTSIHMYAEKLQYKKVGTRTIRSTYF